MSKEHVESPDNAFGDMQERQLVSTTRSREGRQASRLAVAGSRRSALVHRRVKDRKECGKRHQKRCRVPQEETQDGAGPAERAWTLGRLTQKKPHWPQLVLLVCRSAHTPLQHTSLASGHW